MRIGRSRGVTLIEIMIVVAIAGIIAAVTIPWIFNRTGDHKAHAESQARDWAQNLPGYNTNWKFQCVNQDTDGDGYVSCTVFPHPPNPDEAKDYPYKDPFDVECGRKKIIGKENRGCRRPKVKIPSR